MRHGRGTPIQFAAPFPQAKLAVLEDADTAVLTLTASATEDFRPALTEDADTATLALVPSSVEFLEAVDLATAVLALTPAGADTAQFVDVTTAQLTFTITYHECYFRYAPSFYLAAFSKWTLNSDNKWEVEGSGDIWDSAGVVKWSHITEKRWDFVYAGKANDAAVC